MKAFNHSRVYMYMRTRLISSILLVAILIGIGFVLFGCEKNWCMMFDFQKERVADSFEKCEELGFPVMESNPRQCRAGDMLFTENEPGSQPVTTDGNGGGNGSGTGTPAPVETAMVRVTSPLPGSTISSPLVVKGEARGNWYFEASFPVRLLDANGKELAVSPAQAKGEWMTTNFVPFEVTLNFATSTTPTGTLVLEKDNPSGLPENDAQVRIPIRFSQTSAAERTIVLYYYDQDKDKDASGNVLCSAKGLVSVERRIQNSMTPLQDSIKLLLRGELTLSERARGIDTEFPLAGVELQSATISNGVATLTFKDPQNRTSGGSCRASILSAQVVATAKQFTSVNSVVLRPTGVFQP